jgi:hypothetical protein
MKTFGAEDILSCMTDEELADIIKVHKNGFGTLGSAAMIVKEVINRYDTTNAEIIEFREWITQRVLDTICK